MSEAVVMTTVAPVVPTTVIDLTSSRGTKTCKICGQTFVPSGSRRVCCSKTCTTENYRRTGHLRLLSKPRKIQDTSKETMLQYRLAGYNNARIAKMLNCSHATVLAKIGREPEEFKKNRFAKMHTAVVANHKQKDDNHTEYLAFLKQTQPGNLYRCKSCGRTIYSPERRENPTCKVCRENKVIVMRRGYGRRAM